MNTFSCSCNCGLAGVVLLISAELMFSLTPRYWFTSVCWVCASVFENLKDTCSVFENLKDTYSVFENLKDT